MAKDLRLPDPAQTKSIRHYESICLAALLCMTLVLFQHGAGFWCALLLLMGLLSVLGRWEMGPVMTVATLILSVVYPVLAGWQTISAWEKDDFAMILLAAGMLAFIASHCRLLGLVRPLVPTDPRRKKMRPKPTTKRLATAAEVITMLLTLPVWPLLALLAWRILPDDWGYLNISPGLWRSILMLWVLGMGLLVAAGLVGYLDRKQMSPDEAVLYLQDVLWKETRGEQRRVARWLTWARIRWLRRKERTCDTGSAN